MANYSSNVYVSYRVRVRGDLGLRADMHQKVRARSAAAVAPAGSNRARWRGDTLALRTYPLGVPFLGSVTVTLNCNLSHLLQCMPVLHTNTRPPGRARLMTSAKTRARSFIPCLCVTGMQVVVHKVTNLAVDNDASLRAWGDAWPTLLAWGGVGQDLDLREYKMVVRVASELNAPQFPYTVSYVAHSFVKCLDQSMRMGWDRA